jgi:hypothetical protein
MKSGEELILLSPQQVSIAFINAQLAIKSFRIDCQAGALSTYVGMLSNVKDELYLLSNKKVRDKALKRVTSAEPDEQCLDLLKIILESNAAISARYFAFASQIGYFMKQIASGKIAEVADGVAVYLYFDMPKEQRQLDNVLIRSVLTGNLSDEQEASLIGKLQVSLSDVYRIATTFSVETGNRI